ncbi:hypothetical protein [Acinetobacter sp. YH16031]|uniref:hypothetical protein n=1 Tax=Acinetobacter TaxID=469 RepID=UPI0015D3A1E5|nr:hypothetical protein [Acinetobacter sp. YH16031]
MEENFNNNYLLNTSFIFANRYSYERLQLLMLGGCRALDSVFKTQFNSQFLISKNRIWADVLEDLDSKE